MIISAFQWGQGVFQKIYPVIHDINQDEVVSLASNVDYISPKFTIPKIDSSHVNEIEHRLSLHFVPNFFTKDLCENNSLIGRISSILFHFFALIHLSEYFGCFNRRACLASTLLYAEQCWLGNLMKALEKRLWNSLNFGITRVEQGRSLATVVGDRKTDGIEDIRKKVMRLLILTDALYRKHQIGHEGVADKKVHFYLSAVVKYCNDSKVLLF